MVVNYVVRLLRRLFTVQFHDEVEWLGGVPLFLLYDTHISHEARQVILDQVILNLQRFTLFQDQGVAVVVGID